MLPWWCSYKESTCQRKRHKRCRFDPWVGKIPWHKKCQYTPVFLPGKFQEQRNLVGNSAWGHRVRHDWAQHNFRVWLLLLSHFSRVRLCATPSLGFSRQEHWSGLPFPSPMHKSEKWKWSCLVMSDSLQPHELQPTRLLCPWDFPGKSTRVGCHCQI